MMSTSTSADTARLRIPVFDSEQRRTPAIGPILNSTYAIVLAGGRGTRLHQLTDWRAKPAMPFGGKHRIVDFALSNCVNSGIRRIGVATQYKAHSLIQHLQRGWGFLDSGLQEFLDVLPAQQRVDDKWYGGTANAVFQNLDILRAHASSYVLVLAGDHVYKMDYGVMLAEHVARGTDVSVACLDVPVSDASAFGVMQIDEDERILDFVEKPSMPTPLPNDGTRALVSMGIYIFNTEFLFEQLRADARRTDSNHDFGRDVIPALLHQGAQLYAHCFARSCVNMINGKPYWRDVGTLDAYWEANMDLARVQPDLNMYDAAWPIRTLQEQLPPAKFVFDSPHAHGQTWNALISSGCIVSGAAIHRSLLFTSVVVERGSIVEDSVVLPQVSIGRDVRLRRVIVDKYCKLPDGFTAGFDLQEDQRRFHVSPGGIVLITAEMLGQSIHEAP